MKQGFDKLIKYQNLEIHQEEMSRNLNGIPNEHDILEKKLASEREVLDQALQILRMLELRQKESEGDRAQAEQTIQKLRGQLLEVKKNDQYQAMLHEIDGFEKKVSDLEEAEIEILMEIDEEKEKVLIDERSFLARENEIRGQMKLLGDRKTQLNSTIEELEGTLATAKDEVPADWMQAYEQVKNQVRKGPWVVALQQNRCMGCHLSVSNEVAQNFGANAGINHCDQCGRILYIG
jgi:predicted  nucleic acid-binding Zn-ribbon protein